MKLVLLFALLVLGVYTQTVTNWDLSDLGNEDSGVVEADKAPQAVLDRKATNQGFRSQTTKQGKNYMLSLTVTKERSPKVTDVDKILFELSEEDMEDNELTNSTFSYSETASLLEDSLGSTWETMVHLPTEDLTYIELLRLSASLNEFQMIQNGNGGGRARDVDARAPPTGSDLKCICHGTAHKYPVESYTGTRFSKSQPFWGVRILKRGNGHVSAGAGGPHQNKPYSNSDPLTANGGWNRDCILCDPGTTGGNDGLHTDTDEVYDCRYCCFGKCVVTDDQSVNGGTGETLKNCELDYAGTEATTGPNNYLFPNYVGKCIAPRRLTCEEAVEEWCDCNQLIDIYQAESSDTDVQECDTYCDKAVGWSDYFCRNCSEAIWAIDQFFQCPCNDVFWHIANPGFAESGTPSEEEEEESVEESGEGDARITNTGW